MNQRHRIIALLTLPAAITYIVCHFQHICMHGHLYHGPYPWYHYANDMIWLVSLSIIFVLSFKLKERGKKWFLYGSAFLLFSRLILASSGGMILFEIPILIGMMIYATRYIKLPLTDSRIVQK